jgi:uncharacterized membrane protein YsdA (DUF1294 family)
MSTRRAQQRGRSRGVQSHASTIVVLGLLLVMPGFALSRLTPALDWRIVAAIPILFSVAAFFVYRADKRRAQAGEWRVPESTLHFLALLGGWPGAFLAQRVFRHKTSKVPFQVVFWTIVLLHQFTALDALMDWRLTKGGARWVQSRVA